jgi:hypothetical protein
MRQESHLSAAVDICRQARVVRGLIACKDTVLPTSQRAQAEAARGLAPTMFVAFATSIAHMRLRCSSIISQLEI